MKRLLALVPLLVFALVAGWMAVPLLDGSDPRVLPSALIDREAPDFALPPLPGRESGFARDDLGGRPVLVNVFASWCTPCLAEHPVLTRLAREEGVTVYGINYRDEPEDALTWLDRHGDLYTAIGADPEGRVAIDWGVYGVPETFVVDAAGRIRYRHAGPLTPQIVAEEILPLLRYLERNATS
ncbi:MAG: DsbE family thiol:disulfide interchange protein [Alphaproteobacteria bacterium]|jgi:cytochrome c biogenesis protein CcmG/thiol:disulfide interchange protein DsbE|nr:DsbE family thiol:disulfide interchange protein [Alphaproteobacteria bacterium]